MQVDARCCCRNAQYETIDHLFLTRSVATNVWRYFNAVVGNHGNIVLLKQIINLWWSNSGPSKLKPIFVAMPAIIVWQIWKWINTVLHGGSMTINKVIYDINMNIHLLCRVRFPWQHNMPRTVPQIIQLFEGYRPGISCRMVKWILPLEGCYNCNSDGISRGNHGPSSVDFCVRNEVADLIYAAAKRTGDDTNLVAEDLAFKMGLDYCIHHQCTPLVMETDSMAMKLILTGV
ncbi:uncharacterized protein LOC132040230 isoform X1 [Lycium ferocissimum]|uniref:uncharacterized protein LOC132040230 isoform X1 n=1 Tax=Lycium ferocissimum TaxID=112874 RepID=UPI0028157C42|nr:uncharacterized protein LOC132040230 isoform X1 [Lycium ferocissimum]